MGRGRLRADPRRLTYHRHCLPKRTVFVWTVQSLASLFVLLATCVVLYLIPGYAVLGILWPRDRNRLSAAEELGAALGVGFALPPLFIYLSRFVGLKWSAATVWGYLALAAVLLCAPRLAGLARRRPIAWQERWPRPAWALIVLIAITVLALIVRLYTVREFRAGLFGDSVHHTLIVQLLLDNGGLFNSYQPYAPLSSFTYHFGFHANVAFYAWLTGTSATLSTLIVGQVMNAATVPLAYLLAAHVVGDRRNGNDLLSISPLAGLWAAALTGFLNLMPAYYVNWGRYTQLAGQLVLPVVVVAWVTLLEQSHNAPLRAPSLRVQGSLIALCVLLTACLMLTHYIVTIFAAVMVAAYLIALIVYRANLRDAARLAGPAVIAAGGALALALPWIINTFDGGLVRNTRLLIAAVDAARVASYATLTPITPTYLKPWMIWLAVIGLLIALARREWRPAMFAVWSVLIVMLVTPNTIGLPGNGVIDQFTAYIALYLTVLPLVGYALAVGQAWIVDMLGRRIRPTATLRPLVRPTTQHALTTIIIAAICLWGTTWLRNVADPGQQMLTPADERAMAWIRENTPADARFVVNAFPAYGGSLIAGTDGGWWITLLTGRKTNLPPMVYGSERWERDTFYAETNRLAEALRGRPLRDSTPVRIDLTTPDNLARLRAAGLSYVYSGANATPGRDRADWIDVDALRASRAFRLIYERDGVQIFQLVQ